ncbi:MAG TPA: hypothetical protein VKV25_08045, partial [Acidimicrobiales bacterium]|nr:hypothetical protein [Acidimicrobiales bacterium]
MQILLTGHAGLYITAGGSSILCDPWFSPAYFGSWFPFPDNAGIDPEAIGHPTYLYVSHLHKDHFDARFLAEHVEKSATVLLPEFPLDELRRALEDLGFTRFLQTTDGAPVELDAFRVAICTETEPADGPLGDSTLAVDDGRHRLLNQNDCRPRDLDLLNALGPYDVHLLQYSGAIWYPMVYRVDPEEKARLGREKRFNQMSRALRYVEQVGATHVVPFAGPPAFLDDDLFHLNDLDGDPANIFVDQPAFIEFLAEHGIHGAHLAVSGSVLDVEEGGGLQVTHPVGPDELAAMFSDKKAYLSAYRERRRAEIEAACPTPAGGTGRAGEADAAGRAAAVALDDGSVANGSAPPADDLIRALAGWMEPLLAGAPRVRRNLGGPIVIETGSTSLVIDPAAGAVRPWAGEEWEHWFRFEEALLRSLVERHVEDWVNELFLSCRFEAARTGP